MSTLAIWCRVVQSRDVSPHNFDGLAISGLAFSVAPQNVGWKSVVGKVTNRRLCESYLGYMVQHKLLISSEHSQQAIALLLHDH